MNAKELIISIKSLFDPKGAAEASTAIGKVAGKTAEARNSTLGAAQGFAAMGQAAALSGGSVSSLAAALGNMAQQLPALAGAAGPIGLAIGAFLAWKTAIKGVIAAHAENEKSLRLTVSGNLSAAINRLTADYDDLAKAIGKAAAARKGMQTLDDERQSAMREIEDAKVEVEKQLALAKLSPEDDLAIQSVENDFAERAARTAADRAREDALDKQMRLRQAASEKEAQANAAQAQKDTLSATLSGSVLRTSQIQVKQNQEVQSAWTSGGKVRAAEKYQSEIDKEVKAQDALIAQIKDLDETIHEARQSASENYARAELIQVASPQIINATEASANIASASKRWDIDAAVRARDYAASAAAAEEAAQREDIARERDRLLRQRDQAEGSVESAARQVNRRTGEGEDALSRAETAAAQSIPNLNARLDELAKMLEQLNSRQTNARTSD